jgi:hypothetical protein
MNISRRKLMTILGRTTGAISALLYFGPKSLGKIKTEKTEAKKGELLAIDVLVVGGGVQGLVLLNALKQKGYSTVLVTNSDLGAGQTLHSHGSLNSGYLNPRKDLRDSLKYDWLPLAGRSKLQLYGENQFYLLIPPEQLEQLREKWNAFGYENEIVPRNSLPTGFQEGEIFQGNTETQIVKIKEYTFPKKQLVRFFSDKLSDQIITGRVTAFHCVSGRTDRLRERNRETISVKSVEIQLNASGKKITLKPKLMVAATGTGTIRFIESLVSDPSFATSASELGDDSEQRKERILSQLDEVKFRNTHMICIRAPKDILPVVNAFVVEHRLMIITADVNPIHDSISSDDGDLLTWYVTPMDPSALAAKDVPDTAQAKVENKLVVEGIKNLLKVFPSLKTKAEKPGSRVRFFVYAGYKQDIREEKNHPFCKKLEGVDNVIVTLPSLFTGTFVNANKVLDYMDKTLEPGRFSVPVVNNSKDLQIGQVTENTADVKWMKWNEFLETFPGIDV